MSRFLAIMLFAWPLVLAAQPRPHAHNDYLHARPLVDALSHGFGSVEADVFLDDGELLVAHTEEEIRPERTLEKLYLAPLKERFDRRNGRVVANFPSLILLVDFKTEAIATYQALEPLLKKYERMLTTFEGTNYQRGAVSVVISGNRPIAHMAGQPRRLAAIDGRLPDLDENPPVTLFPLISDNWTKTFEWRAGTFTEADRKKLTDAVKRAHDQGRLIRFWAAPDNRDAWELLIRHEVDLINTDRLPDLAEFLRSRSR